MINVAEIIEGLVGIAGREPRKNATPMEKDLFFSAGNLVKAWREPTTRQLAELATYLGAITNEKPDCSNRRDGKSCYRRENESKQKGRHRPIFNYREDEMCEECRTCWHFNMASLLLFSINSKRE